MYDFSKQRFIVTGGATGIGRAITELLLMCGAHVVISARREDVLRCAQQEIDSDRLGVFAADLSKEDNIKNLIDYACEKFGDLSGYINNAGSWTRSLITNLDNEDIIKSVSNNLMTTILGTKHAALAMKKGGSIINMASYAGLKPMSQGSVYSCLKSAVITFTRSSAAELAEAGIRVNCVIPGVIETEMTREHIQANKENLLKPIALKRFGSCEDVAQGVAFLCSSQASYITGTALEITGGKFLTQ
jgi:meso-butanediol dehydrogenase / (S,S)-butanediol dehydrogenase / diacetyl reductase